VKAKDTYDMESDWSDPLIVSISKLKHLMFSEFIETRHPLLYNILTYFFK
jgi:hypothetical protein